MDAPNSDQTDENDRVSEEIDAIFQALKRELLGALGEPEKREEKNPAPLKLVA